MTNLAFLDLVRSKKITLLDLNISCNKDNLSQVIGFYEFVNQEILNIGYTFEKEVFPADTISAGETRVSKDLYGNGKIKPVRTIYWFINDKDLTFFSVEFLKDKIPNYVTEIDKRLTSLEELEEHSKSSSTQFISRDFGM